MPNGLKIDAEEPSDIGEDDLFGILPPAMSSLRKEQLINTGPNMQALSKFWNASVVPHTDSSSHRAGRSTMSSPSTTSNRISLTFLAELCRTLDQSAPTNTAVD